MHITSDTCETQLDIYDVEEPVRARHLEIVRVSEQGQAIGEPTPLTGATANVQENSARLLDMGEYIGVLWSRGPMMYACAGCVADDDLSFVMLSKTDLTPVSDVVTMASDPLAAGMRPIDVIPRAGGGLLLVFAYTLHAIEFAGTAEVSCQDSG